MILFKLRDTVDRRTEEGSEPKLCFDLLIVNTGILIYPHASIRLDGANRGALDGVKALSNMGGLGTGFVRSFRHAEKEKKKVNRSWETGRDRSTGRVDRYVCTSVCMYR